MKRFLPDPLVGAMAGFSVGFMASTNLEFLGIDVAGWPVLGLAILGAVVGCLVGLGFQSSSARTRAVAHWCVAMAAVVGGVAFLAGFVGPIILHPDLPQGPLLGIFCTGPLGTLAGASLGAVIGLLVPTASARSWKGRYQPPA
jgi:hypothetical protein